MRTGKYLLPTAGVLLVLCAVRENPYDPSSPYHREPVLDYTLEYDLTKTRGEMRDDSIYALAPFDITIHASSHNFFNLEETLQVKLEHTFNDTTATDTILPKKLNLTRGGRHHFKIFSTAAYGATATREFDVEIEPRRKPIILSFKLSPDTIPLDPWLETRPVVYFYTQIYDPDTIADSIFYKLFEDVFYPSPAHALRLVDSLRVDPHQPVADTFIDMAFFSFSQTKEKIKQYSSNLTVQINVVIKDKFGRETRAAAPLTFSEKRIIRGFPPHINSIFIINQPPITVGKQVCFGIDAIDYSDQDSVPTKDSTLLLFYWDFGDSTVTTKKYPCNTYSSPGDYIVKSIVTDDSGNTDTASMTVEVQPSSIIRPHFTRFSVETKSTVAPCSIFISASAADDDGYISSLVLYAQGKTIYIDTNFTSVTDWPYLLPTAGTYDILALVFDNDNHYRDTSYTIVITDPEKKSPP